MCYTHPLSPASPLISCSRFFLPSFSVSLPPSLTLALSCLLSFFSPNFHASPPFPCILIMFHFHCRPLGPFNIFQLHLQCVCVCGFVSASNEVWTHCFFSEMYKILNFSTLILGWNLQNGFKVVICVTLYADSQTLTLEKNVFERTLQNYNNCIVLAV